MKVEITVNGRARTIDAAPNLLLVQAIRENLKLTGTHVGCDTAQCGACTVILNGNAVKSCNVLLAQIFCQTGQTNTLCYLLFHRDKSSLPLIVVLKVSVCIFLFKLYLF